MAELSGDVTFVYDSEEDSSPNKSPKNCTIEFSQDLTQEIDNVLLDISNKITQEMLHSPSKTSSCTEKRSNETQSKYSYSIPCVLLSLRLQLLKEINQSHWCLSAINAPPCKIGFKESPKLKALRKSAIDSIFESTSPLEIPTDFKECEKELIESECKALEHRLMLILMVFLVAKEFKKKSLPSVDNLEYCYNCFRIMIKENIKIKLRVNILNQVQKSKRNSNRVQRFYRLVQNNSKYISHVWYGLFLARLQVGIFDGSVENVMSIIQDIGLAIERINQISQSARE